MLAFRTNQPSRYVTGPTGNRMVATPIVRNIPVNLKNLNTRLMSSKNAWTANTSNMLNNIRNNNWRGATRDDIIKFVMYAYYGAFHLKKFFNDDNAEKQIRSFHRAYSKISTRNARNNSMIPTEILWRRLQGLTKASLLTLAKMVEW